MLDVERWTDELRRAVTAVGCPPCLRQKLQTEATQMHCIVEARRQWASQWREGDPGTPCPAAGPDQIARRVVVNALAYLLLPVARNAAFKIVCNPTLPVRLEPDEVANMALNDFIRKLAAHALVFSDDSEDSLDGLMYGFCHTAARQLLAREKTPTNGLDLDSIVFDRPQRHLVQVEDVLERLLPFCHDRIDQDILTLLALGNTGVQAADFLGITPGMVYKRLERIRDRARQARQC